MPVLFFVFVSGFASDFASDLVPGLVSGFAADFFSDRRRGVFPRLLLPLPLRFSGFYQLIHRLLHRFHRFAVDRRFTAFSTFSVAVVVPCFFSAVFTVFSDTFFSAFWAVFVVFFAFTASSVFPAGFPFFPVFFSVAAFAAVFAFALLLLAAPVSGFV